MFTPFRRALLIGLACSAAPALGADWEMSFRLGPARHQDNIAGYPNQARPPHEFDYANGLASGLALGRRLAPHWRGELELTRRRHELEQASSGTVADGELLLGAAMLNAYYDFDGAGAWRPYVGAGLGRMRGALDDFRVDGASLVDSSARAWAFQAIGGIAYRLDDRWQASVDYRFLHTQEFLFVDAAGDVLSTDQRSHALLLGISRSF